MPINEARARTRHELTAADVKRLPTGSTVSLHHFDRYGEHVVTPCTLKRKKNGTAYLAISDYLGETQKQIRTESDRLWYSVP